MRILLPLLVVLGCAVRADAGSIRWLAHQQDSSGAWLVEGKPDVASTGLSILAFLGAGYTDRGDVKSPYGSSVKRGLRFLLRNPGETARERVIVSLALSEAFWMTGNPHYRLPAQRALAALEKIGVGDDPATHAFLAAALKSGRHAKLEVPESLFERERKWLDAHSTLHPAATLTSAVFLASDDPRKSERVRRAVKLLSRERPTDALAWYLGSIGMFQVGGKAWKEWNETMKENIVRKQRSDGSWNGSVEATALYCLCLNIYYRYDRVFGLNGDPAKTRTGPLGRSSLPPLTSRIQLEQGDALDLEKLSADVRFEGFRARVRLALLFFHDGDQMDEGTLQLRLPDGASPHTLAFGNTEMTAPSVDDAITKGAPFRMKAARMVDRERARRAYTTITSERRDPALLEWDGEGVFSTRVFPIEPGKLHQVVIGYDITLPPSGEFELELPRTRRPCDVRIGDENYLATTLRRFTSKHEPATAMIGGGYTAVRLPSDLPAGLTAESATLIGCTDVLVAGGIVAARGEAAAGATLTLRNWSMKLAAPVASKLTPRVYGEIAVEQMEAFAHQGLGVPEAYARHFRVVRATCSLVMLETERDYERFGIRAKDDAGTVRTTPAATWLKLRHDSTPKQRLRWRLQTLGMPTDLLDQVPDAEFADLRIDRTSDADLVRLCEKRNRLKLALVYSALARGIRRESLCAAILQTGNEGFWFDHARNALCPHSRDLVVVLRWGVEDSDVDLHVVDPTGDVCNWRSPRVANHGRLEGDRRKGSEPEIYRQKDAAPGEYVIRANYFRPKGRARVFVIAIGGGKVVRGSVDLEHRDQMVEALRVTIPER